MKYGYFLCLFLLLCSCGTHKYKKQLVETQADMKRLITDIKSFSARSDSMINELRAHVLEMNEMVKLLEAQNAQLKSINLELESKSHYNDTMTYNLILPDKKYYNVLGAPNLPLIDQTMADLKTNALRTNTFLRVAVKASPTEPCSNLIEVFRLCKKHDIYMFIDQ